jgi:hypothetical protein
MGRFYDFFVLVRQILSTYNPGSAHVALENWAGGIPCIGCGCSVSEDDHCSCEQCQERFCGDCVGTCDGCSCCLCSECSGVCTRCLERFCDACLSLQNDTTQSVCRCCQESQNHPTPNQEPSHESPELSPAVEPAISSAKTDAVPASATDTLCVGETAHAARPRRNGSRRVRNQPSGRPTARRRRSARTSSVHRSEC